MRYIDTAFHQLAFAWKLYNYVLGGKIDRNALDKPVTFAEGNMILVLPNKILDDLILACSNLLTISFGAAAITLNRCREERGLRLANPIVSEQDQFAAVA
jgi:hypothetical protein